MSRLSILSSVRETVSSSPALLSDTPISNLFENLRASAAASYAASRGWRLAAALAKPVQGALDLRTARAQTAASELATACSVCVMGMDAEVLAGNVLRHPATMVSTSSGTGSAMVSQQHHPRAPESYDRPLFAQASANWRILLVSVKKVLEFEHHLAGTKQSSRGFLSGTLIADPRRDFPPWWSRGAPRAL